MSAPFNLDGLSAAIVPERAGQIAAIVVLLRAECREHGIRITSDGAVDPRGASRLIDRSAKVMRNWRLPSCDLAPWKRLVGRKVGGRVSYTLEEIAAWRLDNTQS